MRGKILWDVGMFYCPYIPKAFMRVNRDADPPQEEDWISIMHHDLFPIDMEWDPTKSPTKQPTTEDELIEAYEYAKKATERM
jgi:hypothetical protein